jgi:energy-coupling factor transporter ATP-binding protein EcfA2
MFCTGERQLELRLALVQAELEQADDVSDGRRPHVLLVLQDGCTPPPGVLDRLIARWGTNVHVLWFGTSPAAAPSAVEKLIHVGADGTLTSPHFSWASAKWIVDDAAQRLMRANGLDECSEIARSLAPLYDARAAIVGEGLPTVVPLAALIQETVAPATTERAFPILLGRTETGPLTIDLAVLGPHLMIGGTTGSGKSELLQTIAAWIVATYGPDQARLFLFDFKGGATFAGMEGLTSTMGYVTNLTRSELTRALKFLEAELTQRQRRFARGRTPRGGRIRSYEQYRAAYPDEELPRIAVLFEEFGALVGEYESARKTAVCIAQQGRALGVHVVIATQRPSPAVIDSEVQANVAARIALRTVTADESQIIISSNDAAQIPPDAQGRALLRVAGHGLTPFQAGYGGHTEGAVVSHIYFTPFVPRTPSECLEDSDPPLGTTDFEAVLTAHGAVRDDYSPEFDEASVQRGAPTLEASFSGRAIPVPDRFISLQENEVAAGTCDDVSAQTRFERTFDLSRGALLLAGGVGSGKSWGLVALAQQIRSRLGQNCEIVGIDSSGDDLGQVDRSPFNWIVNVSDSKPMELLLRQLETELHSRRNSPVTNRPAYIIIDDIQQMYEQFAYTNDDLARLRTWSDLIRRGRRERIYVIAGSPSQQFGNPSLRGVFAHRLQLRPQPDDVDAFPAAADLHRGVALDTANRQVQLYAPATGGDTTLGPVRFGPLPTKLMLHRNSVPTRPGAVFLGLTQLERIPVLFVPLPDRPLIVASASRSERDLAVTHVESQLLNAGYAVVDVRALMSVDTDVDEVTRELELSGKGSPVVVVMRDVQGRNEADGEVAAALVTKAAGRWPLLLSVDPSALRSSAMFAGPARDALRGLPLHDGFVWYFGPSDRHVIDAARATLSSTLDISDDDERVVGRGWLVTPHGAGIAQIPTWRNE